MELMDEMFAQTWRDEIAVIDAALEAEQATPFAKMQAEALRQDRHRLTVLLENWQAHVDAAAEDDDA